MEEVGQEVGWRGIKCHLPLSVRQPLEHEIEKDMQRKNKLVDFYDKRNGINLASLGDKPYKAVTYFEGFYKTQGLIPGSTNKLYKYN